MTKYALNWDNPTVAIPIKDMQTHPQRRKLDPNTNPGLRKPRRLVPEDNDERFLLGFGDILWQRLLNTCVTDAKVAMSIFQAAAHGDYLRQAQTRAFIGCRRAMEGDHICPEQIILEYAGRKGSKDQGTNQALETLIGKMRPPTLEELETVRRAVYCKRTGKIPLF